MKISGIIALIVIIFVLAGASYFLYVKYQKPINNPNLATLSIATEYNNQKVGTGIIVNNINYNTSSDYYVLVNVSKGGIAYIETRNLKDQYFYKETRQVNTTAQATRQDIILEEVKDLNITKISDDPIVLNVYSENFRDLEFCLKWSLDYVFVNSNYPEILKPKDYENWDKCYLTGKTLKGDSINISISYRELAEPNERDYINISIMTPEFIGIKDIKQKIK